MMLQKSSELNDLSRGMSRGEKAVTIVGCRGPGDSSAARPTAQKEHVPKSPVGPRRKSPPHLASRASASHGATNTGERLKRTNKTTFSPIGLRCEMMNMKAESVKRLTVRRCDSQPKQSAFLEMNSLNVSSQRREIRKTAARRRDHDKLSVQQARGHRQREDTRSPRRCKHQNR